MRGLLYLESSEKRGSGKVGDEASEKSKGWIIEATVSVWVLFKVK